MLPDWLRRFTQRRRLDGLSEPLQRELERKNREDEFQLREWRKARWGRWLAVIAFLAIPFMLAIAGPSTDEKPKFPIDRGVPEVVRRQRLREVSEGQFDDHHGHVRDSHDRAALDRTADSLRAC